MKRALIRAAAMGAVCVVLVSGCGRHPRQERGGTAPVGVTVPATPTPSAGIPDGTGSRPGDVRVDEVDGLLGQLDGQLNSDNAAPSDAD